MYTLLLVDDHLLFREGLGRIINHWKEFTVVGEAANGAEAIRLARELRPDIILMDLAMPEVNGIEATATITSFLPETKIVVLTMSEADSDLFQAIHSGATGYILKDTPSKRLHDQLRRLMQGEAPISGAMTAKILRELKPIPSKTEINPAPEAETLTPREQEVLELVAAGRSNLEIAETLFLSENTVKKYFHNILAKLHLNNRVEAAAYAIRHLSQA